MTGSPSPPQETVEVIDEERIVPRGTAQVNWFVRLNDAWVHVSTWPGAQSERLDAGAGTVWQSRTEIQVPRGARLMRVESRPNDYARESPLDYLTRGAPSKSRRVRRNYYVVGRAGNLIASVEPSE
ncbi:MAG TPA: hypothetical protein VHM25_00070 [Polyangiaceae bacterium]|jgi:hypothetical protein|nr:hypothetical protein [Polyangiaceae bacterium]